MENAWKINGKSMENQWKINGKSIENQWTSFFARGQRAFKLVLKSIKEKEGEGGEEREGEKEKERRKDVKTTKKENKNSWEEQ